MVVVLVFRQKYELQTLNKYILEELNVSRFLITLPCFLFLSLAPYMMMQNHGLLNGYDVFSQFLFMVAYSHFFYGALGRTFGFVKPADGSHKPGPSLITEEGGIDTKVLGFYWDNLRNSFDLTTLKETLVGDMVIVTWNN